MPEMIEWITDICQRNHAQAPRRSYAVTEGQGLEDMLGVWAARTARVGVASHQEPNHLNNSSDSSDFRDD
jgi:hypothetical protein